jgi:hypothetical protein
MIDLKQEMCRVVARFRNDIEDIARRASLSLFESVMPAARGRRPRSTKGKRTPSDLGELENRFETFVRANPGLRIEQINGRIGTTTKELVLPIHKLISKGAIVTKGRVRSTTYYPGRK